MNERDPHEQSALAQELERQLDATRDPVSVTATTVDTTADGVPVTDRQQRIEGFDQTTLAEARVLLVGAGGIGGEIGDGLVRKGVGELVVCDEDAVDATNLNRQKFREADIDRNKAVALAERLAPRGTTGTDITAHPRHFQDAVALDAEFDPDLVVCAPDNDAARLAVCDHFHGDVPAVYTGLDTEANGGYVFVQDDAPPCFRCYRPEAGPGGTCPAAPAVIDPTKLVAGLALFAVDSVLMSRHRAWDAFEFYLSGVLPTRTSEVEAHSECEYCRPDATGGRSTPSDE